MKEEKNMKMKKALKAMLAVTACACMLTVPLNIHAAEPTDGLVVDGSLLIMTVRRQRNCLNGNLIIQSQR